MEFSGYLGLKLEEAEQLLKESGKEYCVKIITPFYKGQAKPMEEGAFRIVRINEDETGAFELTVCKVPEKGPEKNER